MDNLVFLAVVFSAIFQASWNFFAKKSSAHKSALLYIGWFGLGLVGVPLASIFTDFSQFSPLSVYYILLSGFIHFLYVYLLGRAYTLGDISVVYPISRGLGIVLTTVFSHFLALDSISIFGFFGIGLVVSGCFLVASKELKSKSGSEGFWAAALVALAVSAYSIADSQGVHHVPPLFFIAVMNLSTALFALPFLMTSLRTPSIKIIKHHKREAILVAVGGSSAYLIILWAFQQSQTSYVVALREFSVVIASVLGILFLKEKIYRRKLIALALLVFGIFLVKIS